MLSHDLFQDGNLSDERIKEFFDTGFGHVDGIFKIIEDKFQPNFSPDSVLDFGCGTGRLAIPFASRAKNVVGLDISTGMLEEAKKNAEKYQLDNISFRLSDDDFSEIQGERFDLVNSFIVLQHINVGRGMKMIGRMLDFLNEGGIGVIQVIYYSKRSWIYRSADYLRYRIPLLHTLLNAITGRPISEPLMQMNRYDLNELFFLLQEKGITNTLTLFENQGDFLSTSIVFQKARG